MTLDVKTSSAFSAAHARKKRGFTLTEIAIVLGIIGLILGAIWVAAASVYNNLRVARASTELLQIAQGIRAMYSTSSTVDTAINMTFGAAAQGAAVATYIQAGVFPTDTFTLSGTNYTTTNPWGGNIAVTPVTINVAGDAFQVAFDDVPQNACVTFITRNTGAGRDQGLVGIANAAANTVPTAATATTFPVLASTALGTYCSVTSSTGQAIGFTFRLKG